MIYKSFVSLGRYIPKCFILFIAMVNGIVSLISLSVFSLLVYKNAITLFKSRFFIKFSQHFQSYLSEGQLVGRLLSHFPNSWLGRTAVSIE